MHKQNAFWLFAIVCFLSISSTGCIARFAANLLHAARGNEIPAKFDGLEAKKVAVVCVANTEAFGPRPISLILGEKVARKIQAGVKDVSVVDQQRIADWMDENEWDEFDYSALGKGVGAEMVVAIDLDSFSIYDGKTMYKGRADVSVVVYDIASNKMVFEHRPGQLQYPKNTGYHTTDLLEHEFRSRFVEIVASQIARNFHGYDVKEDFARDTSVISTLSAF